MKAGRLLHERHRFRLALCGHKAVEAGAVCLLLMVQGDVVALTPAHFLLASKTGLLSVFPAMAVSFTPYARHLLNRWTCSVLLAFCTFVVDAAVHESHYPGELTEAALTALGAFAFSIAVSYTPVGKYIDRLGHSFLRHSEVPPRTKSQTA